MKIFNGHDIITSLMSHLFPMVKQSENRVEKSVIGAYSD